MTWQIILLLFVIGTALVFFSFEWAPADVTALGVLMALILTGLLPAKDAFASFGSDTVMLILGLLIMTAALLRTGVVDLVGRFISRRTQENRGRLLLIIMGAATLLSTIMSNTASTAFFVPIVIGLAKQAKIQPSKLLMPLAFASILASSVTLISTSTNIVVSGLMTRYGLPPMRMFEMAPVGIPIAIIGLAYMLTLGKYLIPSREDAKDDEGFGVRPYLTEVLVRPDSTLAGKTLAQAGVGRDLGLTILRIVRDKDQYISARGDTVLQAGDILLVEGESKEILNVKDAAGIDIKADVKLSDPLLQGDQVGLVECILLPRSPLLGRTLKGFSFRERYGLQVLGINRHGKSIVRKISQIPLRVGDVLLLQGDKTKITALAQEDKTFRILTAVDDKRPNLKRAPLAIFIFLGVLALGAANVVSLPVAAMLGAFLVLAARCITPEEAYREVEWKAIILIGCMLALGAAMDHSGAAKFLAGKIVTGLGDAGPRWILSGFFLLTVALTQPMSNQAAAVVVLPVAIQTALQLDLNPRTFAIMIAVAASCSYITPLEPSCLMVYGPGRYRFGDFLKVGSILTLLIFALALLIVPKLWPF